MWESESESHGRECGMGSFEIERHDGLKNDAFVCRDQSWYVSSDIPSDLVVKVGGVSFHLHKYPILSRSGRLNRIVYETLRESEPTIVEFDLLPGGPESFELAAKFCYGIAVDLTSGNISGLRCAAEYLEMTEDLEEGNLIFKTEAFLSYVVLSSWKDSIIVLKSCEGLSPWAENLQIVRRCSESIAWKACANPRGIRWAYTGRPSPKWNSDSKESSPSRAQPVPPDWWFEDVSILRIDHFVRVVTAIKVKGMRFNLIGAAIMQYAAKWLPGLKEKLAQVAEEGWSQGAGLHMIIAGGVKEDLTGSQIREQRMVIESLISIIPPQKDSVSCNFLLRLLRLANMLKVAPALVTELEKRVGMQLEQATLPDLLIPSFNGGEMAYDVDLVQRLVEHFLVQEQTEASSPGRGEPLHEINRISSGPNAKIRVARLIDSYLTEVSRDRNLSLTKFQVLAETLPESTRSSDDGLYRAVDSYLKAHPMLTEHERKRLCRVMDCQKLSIDACMHAAQNERLPSVWLSRFTHEIAPNLYYRIMFEVLFSEQVKISNALANSTYKQPGEPHFQQLSFPTTTHKQLLEGTPQSFQEGWTAAKKDINTLKFELESMKAKYLELQNDMDTLQKQFEKTTAGNSASAKPGKQQMGLPWTSGWRKLSKLTKMNNTDAQEMGGAHGTVGVPSGQGRKGVRRWRNSIS